MAQVLHRVLFPDDGKGGFGATGRAYGAGTSAFAAGKPAEPPSTALGGLSGTGVSLSPLPISRVYPVQFGIGFPDLDRTGHRRHQMLWSGADFGTAVLYLELPIGLRRQCDAARDQRDDASEAP